MQSLCNLWIGFYMKLVLTLFLAAGFSVNVAGQESNVSKLIRDLHQHRWVGPAAVASPLQWDLNLTEPMREILEIGAPAQLELIDNINDPLIKDQVIILLGGVGDERAVGPIIRAMIQKEDLKSNPNSRQINLAANIALTNITVADVIWHHGGGIVQTEPPEDSSDRWQKWWEDHSDFAVKNITTSRKYSNYPNYGIYKQP